MRKLAIIAALMILSAVPLPAAEVKNVKASQVGNRVQFTYDLEGEGEAEVAVVLTVQDSDRKTADLHLEGDVGKVKPGGGKVIWWNVLQDFPRGLNSEVKWRVEAGGKSKGFGITVQELTPEIAQNLGISPQIGVVVYEVRKGSPADDAGIQSSDIILQINKVKISSLDDYGREIKNANAKNSILLLIKRGKATFFVSLRK